MLAAKSPARPRWWEDARTVMLAVLIALGVRVGVAQAYEVDGPSMEPSLVTGERLLVLRAAYGLSLPGLDRSVATWNMPKIGDVVIVQSPLDGLDLVKRVVGLPGDTIEVRHGILWRNGAPVSQADRGPCDPVRHTTMESGCRVVEEGVGGRRWRTSRTPRNKEGFDANLPLLDVPEGHVFVMGDHRDRSNDSRVFGPVPIELLRGRVLLVD